MFDSAMEGLARRNVCDEMSRDLVLVPSREPVIVLVCLRLEAANIIRHRARLPREQGQVTIPYRCATRQDICERWRKQNMM
jgi:hypothetical protein